MEWMSKIGLYTILLGLLFVLPYQNKNLFLCNAIVDSSNQIIPSNKKSIVSDTSFLLKKITPDYLHLIYIEKNKNAPPVQNLLNFKLTKEEKENVQLAINSLHKTQKSLSLYNLPKEWLPLYRYKKKDY